MNKVKIKLIICFLLLSAIFIFNSKAMICDINDFECGNFTNGKMLCRPTNNNFTCEYTDNHELEVAGYPFIAVLLGVFLDDISHGKEGRICKVLCFLKNRWTDRTNALVQRDTSHVPEALQDMETLSSTSGGLD